MISFCSMKTNLYLVVLVSVLVQIRLFYKETKTTQNLDAKSAISRAKTESCKRELEDFANREIQNDELPPLLRRTCGLDADTQRNQRIFCISNSTGELIQLDDQVSNETNCLDLCFSYGHSRGGFHLPTKSCFCADNELSAPSDEQNDCSRPEMFDLYIVNIGIYYPNLPIKLPSTAPKSANNANQSRPIKIAYLLILNSSSRMHIRRLISNIYSKSHIYYLHVDGREDHLFSELLELEQEFENLILARSRFNTIWGGPSLLRMIIDALRHLSKLDWDYLINLSESDFPIKPTSTLEAHLSSNPQLIYLKSHRGYIKGYSFIKKQGLDKNFYQCEDRAWKMGKRTLPRGIVYSGGSDWFVLPRNFCMYIIDNLSNPEGIVKPLVLLYNYTLLPAESFFHTLALNSEFCDRFVDGNLRVTNWQRKGCQCQHNNVVDWCGCSPLVYRWSDWERLERTSLSNSLFFSRKFDPTISSSIIGAVEQRLVRGKPASLEAELNTRYWKNIHRFSNSSETTTVLNQFGQFALNQIYNLSSTTRAISAKLQSVDLYFNQDRFVGLIYGYCDNSECMQVLVEKNSHAHLINYFDKCFNSSDHTLTVIEVNHGFDTGERLFREHQPLNDLSNIVVYHEWLVHPPERLRKNSTQRLKFIWFDPAGRSFVQNIKLKSTAELTRLTLAHRLNIPKPIISGLWTLTISHKNQTCLDYSFLVFDENSFSDNKISQDKFNKFYTATKTCLVSSSNGDEICNNSNWSPISGRY